MLYYLLTAIEVICVYDRNVLAEIIKALRSKGIDGVIIGSTSYMLALGFKEFEDDLDIFVTSLSPTFDEDVIRSRAEELGCFVGQTEWGTPQLHCRIKGKDIIVELYENMYDFYIPEDMLNEAITYRVNDVKVKALKIEDYIIIKVKTGRERDIEDVRYLSDLIRSGKLKIDMNIMRKRLRLFEDYEVRLITKKLESVGIKL
ncbi:MAG: nucleotidyltransferase [Desulfurococcales archaeon ex4484_42]|nr:MAG: nucleotidyltransferase [Desulfurococcales archaeon ex4484_42]